MLYLKAFILSLIQALTEFIPVSSSGHLIIASDFINYNTQESEIFRIIIQLASTLAVIVFFRKKLFSVAFTLHKSKASRNFAYKFIIALLPCALSGITFYKYIKEYLHTELIVAASLILGGIAFLLVDKYFKKPKFNTIDEVNNSSALKIGLYQILSIVPGVSRSGSTIVGGLLSGLSRKTAVEFSFILSIPITIMATLYDLYKNIDYLQNCSIKILLFGFIITFLISISVIKWFLDYVSTHNFNVFGYYRIVLGAIIIASIYFI